MTNKAKIIGLLMVAAAYSQAGITSEDFAVYDGPTITADTGLDDSATSTTKYLSINSPGDPIVSDSAGTEPYFKAYRDRDTKYFVTSSIEEFVWASTGIFINSISYGTAINSGLDSEFAGGNLLYDEMGRNNDDLTFTTPTDIEYLGFRISAGGDDYYYGWVEVYGEIQLDPAGSASDNRAMVRIARTAILTVPNETILAGQVPEPTVMSMVGLCGLGLLMFRRRFCA